MTILRMGCWPEPEGERVRFKLMWKSRVTVVTVAHQTDLQLQALRYYFTTFRPELVPKLISIFSGPIFIVSKLTRIGRYL